MQNAPTLTYPELIALSPCSDDLKRVVRKLGGPRKWNGRKITAREAAAAGVTLNDIVWTSRKLAVTNEGIRARFLLWGADCAAHVLHIFEDNVPNDGRPREAIKAAAAAANAAASFAEEKTWQFDRLLDRLDDKKLTNLLDTKAVKESQ